MMSSIGSRQPYSDAFSIFSLSHFLLFSLSHSSTHSLSFFILLTCRIIHLSSWSFLLSKTSKDGRSKGMRPRRKRVYNLSISLSLSLVVDVRMTNDEKPEDKDDDDNCV